MIHWRLLPLVVFFALAACTTVRQAPIEQTPDISTLEDAPPAPAAGPAPAPRDSRQAAMAQYRAVLESDAAAELRTEVMRRSAELQMQTPAVSAQHGKAGELQAAAFYEDMLRAGPGAAGNDLILYQLARAYETAGERQRTLAALSRLLQEYPGSALANEARFRRAEALYADGRYAEAGADYEAVRANPAAAAFHLLARYKSGWCHFKQAQYRPALTVFRSLLEELLAEAKPGSAATSLALDSLPPARRELAADSLRAAALSAALLDGPAAPSLRTPERPYTAALTVRLAELYVEKADYKSAALAYQSFIGAYPEHPATAGLRLRLIDAHADAGSGDAALRAKEDLLRRAASGAADAAPPDKLKAYYADVTRHHHARAQRSKQTADYTAAARWYVAALEKFPEQQDWRYLYAELLFESGADAASAEQYERLAYDTPGFNKAEKAAYVAVVARRRSAGTQLAGQRAFAEAAERFAARFPSHAERKLVLVQASEAWLAAGEPTRAAAAAQQAQTAAGGAEMNRAAYASLAHARFKAQEFPEAEQAAARWLALADARDPQRGRFQEIQSSSAYRQAERKRDAGDTAGAISDFLRIAALTAAKLEDPAGRIRATAGFDAAALLIQQKEWTRASQVLEQLRVDFPQHPQKDEITRRLAAAYTELQQPAKAAAEWSRLANAAGNTELGRAAAFEAAQQEFNAGRGEPALNAFKQYLQRHPQPLEPAQEARTRLAELYRRQTDAREEHWLNETIKAENNSGNARSRTLAAQAALRLAERARERFLALPLKSLTEAPLRAKRERFESARSAYTRAANFRIAEVATAAAFRIGELYQGLAVALRQAPPPGGLDEAGKQAYAQMLDSQSTALLEQAAKAHSVNLERASDPALAADPWIAQSRAALAGLTPTAAANTSPPPTSPSANPGASHAP
ncbi:MAG: tetratricopeptide repeat protein [Nevskiales bacterium]